MQKRKFDELISCFNRKVSDMDIDINYKMELLGMVTALGYAHEKETKERKTGRWIPCSERLPIARRSVIISTKNWTGEGCYWETTEHHVIWKGYRWNATYWDDEVTAWMPLPEPYKEDSCNRCDYLGESCVGEGCWKLTERKDSEAE